MHMLAKAHKQELITWPWVIVRSVQTQFQSQDQINYGGFRDRRST